jgi:hypothetical protein
LSSESPPGLWTFFADLPDNLVACPLWNVKIAVLPTGNKKSKMKKKEGKEIWRF